MTERLAGGLAVAALLGLVGCTLAVPATPTLSPGLTPKEGLPTPDHTPLTTIGHTPLPTSGHTPLPTVTQATPTPTSSEGLAGWPMFHHDEAHTGNAAGLGRIASEIGPQVLATYRLFDQPPTEDDLWRLRWTSTLPLADLNGDGRLEVVVTTPDVAPPTLARLNGEPIPNAVKALAYVPGNAALQQLWSYDLPSAPGEAGLDTYSPALADADGDGLADVIFTARDRYVRALKGTDGSLIWQFDMGAITEAGPMLSDLDGDGVPEVIVVTDCAAGIVACRDAGTEATLYVLPSRGSGSIEPLWSFKYLYKMDSAEPAIARVEGLGKVIVAGTWGGQLLTVYRESSGEIRDGGIDLRDIEPDIPAGPPPVIRTSPLVIGGHGTGNDSWPTVVFGWLPTDENAWDGRLTAIRLRGDGGQLALEPLWTIDDFDSWKSSPAVVHQPAGGDLIAFGYGLGIGPPPTQSGPVGSCQEGQVNGGVAAVDTAGNVAWDQTFDGEQGNVRASAAVADMNGDTVPDVILPAGCYGELHAFDGISGEVEWNYQLGPRSQGSPSIGDLDADGWLEIVLSSYDGQVWVLGK